MTRNPTREVRRWQLSRRDLLKALPAAGVLAASGTLAGWGAAEERTLTGTCRLCMGRCGIRATVRGDRVIRVEGDPAAQGKGFICMHGLALREIVHSADRVRRPLKRVGDSFEEISWQRAYEEIAGRLTAVKEEFGPQALAVHSGWGLVEHPILPFLMRFCQAFGTPNYGTVESLCTGARRIGESLTAGSTLSKNPTRSPTVVFWGVNPPVSQPISGRVLAGVTPSGRNLVVIDPVRTELAATATVHLQLRPGTDGALALGLMHVMVEEGLHDRTYLERYTVGFEGLLELIERYDPARVAQITSLRTDDIYRVARLIAREGPTAIWTGLGIEHHENAVQTARAIAVLAALCGDIGIRRGNLLTVDARSRREGQPLPCLQSQTTPRPVPPPVGVPPIGYDEYPIYEIFTRQAQANLFATAILEDEPYPLRALILFGANPMLTSPGSERLRRAADELSLLVAVDPFLTASGELADYVLPAATFAEGMDGAFVEERHESRGDWEILTGLAAGLGLERYFPWSTLEEAMAAPHEVYMQPRRTLRAERSEGESAVPLRFPTVSGKIEIYSRALEQFGYDPLPEWKEPSELRRIGDEFPLILVTGPRTPAYINSQFRQIPSVRRKMPRPLVEMHPETATRAGVDDGDPVTVVSPHGRISLNAKVTARVRPDCVVVPAGWSDANVNILTHDGALDPISGFPDLRAGVCRLERQPA